MRSIAAALILTGCLFIAGCAQTADVYEGPPRSDAELAIIENDLWSCDLPSCVREIRIAGHDEAIFRSSAYPSGHVGKLRLAPGKYQIYLRHGFMDPHWTHVSHTGEVNLQAGKTYRVIGEKLYRTFYVWMEDASGEVLLGKKGCEATIWTLYICHGQ